LSGEPIGKLNAVNAYRLHEATRVLGGNPNPPAKVENVVVLFAGRYAPDESGALFGIMFDRGYTTDDDPNANLDYTGHPREGCAIFLDPIRTYRRESPDFERETRFTVIHEMGHIFNLQHTLEPSYLVSSRKQAPFGNEYFDFTRAQMTTLSACSTSDNVRPGGAPFEDVGPFAAGDRATNRKRPPPDLALRLYLPLRPFWPFEPVELDIELAGVGLAGQSVMVPNRLDPGFENFRIWIEDPLGERRFYRSPRRYCAFPARRRIAVGRPFRRDVSLFLDRAGFTFRRAGPHRVWAEFEVRAGAWLRSNVIEASVRPAEDRALYARARAHLSGPKARRLLYHRELISGPTARALERFAAEHPRWEGVGGVHYGLGRALVASGIERGGRAAKARVERGREHLQRAAQRENLGITQRIHASELIEMAR